MGKIIVTQKEAVANFEEIAHQLMESAPSEKAADFCSRVVAAIRAKGDEWINLHQNDLQVTFVPTANSFPVCDNRAYYIGQWQVAAR